LTWQRGGVLCLFVSLGWASLGCAHVAPNERGRLAHPTMAPDYGASLGVEHLQTLHEGAIGGDVKTASGCGCN
jgi:hypothetical protein